MTLKSFHNSVLYKVLLTSKKRVFNKMIQNEEKALDKIINDFIDEKKLFFIFEDIHQEMPPDSFVFSRWQRCIIQYEEDSRKPEEEKRCFVHIVRWDESNKRPINKIDIFKDMLTSGHLLINHPSFEEWSAKLGYIEGVDEKYYESEIQHSRNFRDFLETKDYAKLIRDTQSFFKT